MKPVRERLRSRLKALKRETITLYFAYRDPRVKWYSKALILLTLGYALSPIDLIPDFIPVLGYLDDVFIVPLGIYVSLKTIPRDVLADCRARAGESVDDRRWRIAGAVVVIVIWAILLAVVAFIIVSIVLR